MLAQKAWRMIRTLIFTYLVSGVLLTALAFALSLIHIYCFQTQRLPCRLSYQ